MLLKISYPCIGGLFVLSAQIGAVHERGGGFFFLLMLAAVPYHVSRAVFFRSGRSSSGMSPSGFVCRSDTSQ